MWVFYSWLANAKGHLHEPVENHEHVFPSYTIHLRLPYSFSPSSQPSHPSTRPCLKACAVKNLTFIATPPQCLYASFWQVSLPLRAPVPYQRPAIRLQSQLSRLASRACTRAQPHQRAFPPGRGRQLQLLQPRKRSKDKAKQKSRHFRRTL